MTYRIRDWTARYEINRTRELKRMDWVPMPNRMDGDGYIELISHKHGPALYGAWLAMALIASRCVPRGTLLRADGTAHNPESLAKISRIPSKIFAEALPILLKIGWIEDVDTTTHLQVASESKSKTEPKLNQGEADSIKSKSKTGKKLDQLEDDLQPTVLNVKKSDKALLENTDTYGENPAGWCGEGAGIPQEGAVRTAGARAVQSRVGESRAEQSGTREIGARGYSPSECAERLYKAHPKKKNKPLVEAWCVEAWNAADDPVALFREIERVHAIRAKSENWTKQDARYCPKLDEWLSDEGYTADPEPKARNPTSKRPAILEDWDSLKTPDEWAAIAAAEKNAQTEKH